VLQCEACFVVMADDRRTNRNDQLIITERFEILVVVTMKSTDMRRLTTGIRSEKCVVRRLSRCANVIECTIQT
jgi:hypothetical protein